MIISQQIPEAEVEEMLAFYQANFDTVDLVRCQKCGSAICLELTGPDPMGMRVNDLGKIVVPVGDMLSGHRVRLDHAATGERMVGYQCANRIKNENYEVEHRTWEKARAKHAEDYAHTIRQYQAEHEKRLKPHKDKMDKAYAKATKEYRAALKKIGPGEPLPSLDLPTFVPPADIIYDPPVQTPFAVPEPQEWVECGNDTRLADVEVGLVPTDNAIISLSPFEKMKISETIAARGVNADFKQLGNKKYFETFSVERIK